MAYFHYLQTSLALPWEIFETGPLEILPWLLHLQMLPDNVGKQRGQ